MLYRRYNLRCLTLLTEKKTTTTSTLMTYYTKDGVRMTGRFFIEENVIYYIHLYSPACDTWLTQRPIQLNRQALSHLNALSLLHFYWFSPAFNRIQTVAPMYTENSLNQYVVPLAHGSPPSNGISIGPAAFAGFAVVTNRQTDTDRLADHATLH